MAEKSHTHTLKGAKMPYKRLANAVLWFHFGWVALLVLGGVVLQFVFPWYKTVHISVSTVTIVSWLFFLGCPLTELENSLREKGGGAPGRFHGSFVCHYLKKRFGWNISPVAIALTLVMLFAVSIITYHWQF